LSDIDVIIERLEGRGHRVTESRRRVLAAALAQPAHFTVDDVLHKTRGVGRATVFRTIKLLLDLNILCRILLDDGTLHYRVSTRGHHHHLVCNDCGRVEDFTRCDVPSLVRRITRGSGYEIEGHWLEMYGRCRDCRDRAARRRQNGRSGNAGRAVARRPAPRRIATRRKDGARAR
jgi:Fur family ferric uptake transcriptional regulator